MKKTEAFYKMLVENMNEAVWMGDENCHAVYVNPKMMELTGYSEEELLNSNAFDFMDSDTARKASYNRKRLKEERDYTRLSYEGKIIRKDGEKKSINISVTPLEGGRSICVLTDLQTQKSNEPVYKTLAEYVNKAIWLGDCRNRTVYVNPKFSELTGYVLRELKGKVPDYLIDEVSWEKVKGLGAFEKENRKTFTYEASIKTKSGGIIPFQFHSSPLPGNGRICILTDLREQKQKESVYQSLVENMNQAVWMGDENERTVYANPKFCSMMGYSLEELVGGDSYELLDRECVDFLRKINEVDRKQKKISSQYEITLISKTGEKIPVSPNGSPLPDGGSIAILTDLRQIKQQETTELILKNATEHASDAIIIADHNFEIQSWNHGAKILFGYKKNEIVGKNISQIFDLEKVKLFSQEKRKNDFEIYAKHKNESQLQLSMTLTSLHREKKKEPSFYLFIARDITQQAKMEEELFLKYQKIREAYNYLGTIRRQKDYIFELLDFANTTTDKKSLANFIVNSVVMLTKVDACYLRLYNPKTQMIEMLSSFGLSADWVGQASSPYKDSLLEEAFQKQSSLKILDIGKKRRSKLGYLARKDNLQSALVIPLMKNSELIGGLMLYVSEGKSLEIFEDEFIEKYAKVIALVLSNICKN